MARALMVVAPETFRDEEYAHPKQVLESRGVLVDTASTRRGICRGRFGLTTEANLAIGEADAADYDAVIFVGGGGAEIYFDDVVAHALATRAYELGRIVAAICIAPSVLAHAGLLAERHVTSFETRQKDLEAHGARFTGRPVEVDATIITANGPDAAYEFGETIADAIAPR